MQFYILMDAFNFEFANFDTIFPYPYIISADEIDISVQDKAYFIVVSDEYSDTYEYNINGIEGMKLIHVGSVDYEPQFFSSSKGRVA